LVRKLRKDNEAKYRKIMKTRRNAKKTVDLQISWAGLVNGTPLRRIASKQRISEATLAKKLRRDNRMEYEKIMRTRRTIEKHVDLQVVWTELESSAVTLKAIAQKDGISRPGLAKKLRRDNEPRYRKIMKIEKAKRRIFRGYFGSPDARKQGADSLFELRVRSLLEKNEISFRFHVSLRIGKYRYIPDFVLFDNFILEATGFFTNSYWRYYRQKTMNYIEAGYLVSVVAPDHLCKKAESYLPNRVKIIKYSRFKKNPKETLGFHRVGRQWQMSLLNPRIYNTPAENNTAEKKTEQRG
jgi:transcriptional regulator with XRE-family HTH domain